MSVVMEIHNEAREPKMLFFFLSVNALSQTL